MSNNVLKEEILNGDRAIFKVVNGQEEFVRYEILGYNDMLDLLTESNGERVLDLAKLYLYKRLQFDDDEIFYIVCGYNLIARLIEDTAKNIQEDIEFSIDLEEEKYNEFERS